MQETRAAEPTSLPKHQMDIPTAGWPRIVGRAAHKFRTDHVTDQAAALTYYGVLALFPGILVLVSLLGLFGKDKVATVLANVDQLAPGGVRTFLNSVVEQTQGRPGPAGVAAVVGTAFALWSASGYVAAFMRTSNQIYGVEEGRPIWQTAPVRLAVTVATVLMLLLSALLVVLTGPVARQVGHALGIGDTAVTVWDIAKWPVLMFVVSLMFSLLYWACPNVKQQGFRWITPGGLVAVVIWLVASTLFGVYVAHFGSYNQTYGALATAIVFLVWLWITNIAILLGLELNAEAEHARVVRAGLPEDVEPFVELRDDRKLSTDGRKSG